MIGCAGRHEGADDLVRTSRVLDRHDQHDASVDVDSLGAAERRPCGGQPRRDLLWSRTERTGEGGCGESVVDVVETGQRDLYAPGVLGEDEIEGDGFEPVQLDR